MFRRLSSTCSVIRKGAVTAAFLLMLLLAALPFSVSDGVASGIADNVQPLVYCALEPPQGQSHNTKVTSVEAEPELERAPNMLTAIVIVGGSADPLMLVVYCMKRVHMRCYTTVN